MTAVEIDDGLAGQLRQRLSGRPVEVVTADATELPLPAGRFSAAACFTMLHHISDPDGQGRALAVARSGTAPRRLLLTSTGRTPQPGGGCMSATCSSRSIRPAWTAGSAGPISSMSSSRATAIASASAAGRCEHGLRLSCPESSLVRSWLRVPVQARFQSGVGDDRRNASGRDLRIALGHEGCGVITAVGRNIDDRRHGERVVIEPNIPCGKCPACEGTEPPAARIAKANRPRTDHRVRKFVGSSAPRAHSVSVGMTNAVSMRARHRQPERSRIASAGPAGGRARSAGRCGGAPRSSCRAATISGSG